MNDNPIRVLIVDDEAIIRKGLIKTVPWEKYNMCVVADAPNGKKGWEAFLKYHPEVIITDIVMPEMNGIQLAKNVKEYAPETKILLLSCHSDFEYAQQGMKIGASGYLLKTSYNDDELEEFLDIFQKDIELYSISVVAEQSHVDMQKLLLEWSYGLNDHFLHELDILRSREWSWMQEPSRVYLIIGSSVLEAGHSRNLVELSMKPEAAMVPMGEDNFLLFCSEANTAFYDNLLSDLKAVYGGLRWYKSELVIERKQWIEDVKAFYAQMELEKRYQIHVAHWPDKITEAVQFMVRHVNEPLSVSTVAEEIKLSRSHFSMLFKKVVGESFVSFMYRIKLKVVCELLCTTSLTIQEISDKVGIPDAKYFSKWFKRCTGETPSQYRTHKNTMLIDQKATITSQVL